MDDVPITSPTLPRRIDLPPAQDFDKLRHLGLERIKALSGALWTDHNLHDPGITILEVLCYALTDVAYRADLPIEDILATHLPGPDSKARPVPQNFPAREEILTGRPVTGNDYRRLLIDGVRDVRNAWLRPVRDTTGALVPGQVDVLLDLHDFPEASGMARIDPFDVETKARALLNENRGLGLRVREVAALDRGDVVLSVTAAIGPERAAIDIAADMLFQADLALNPPPVPKPFKELLNAGTAPDVVFSGPRLRVGQIRDEDLLPLQLRTMPDRIAGALRDVRGVVELTSLRVKRRTPTTRRHPDLPLLPRIATDTATLAALDLRLDGVAQATDPDFVREVVASLRHREELRRHDWQNLHQEGAGPAISIGRRHPELGRSRSVQHDFPAIYGLGIGGLAPSATTGRHAQLRGYLAVFDQIIADFLGQIENAPRLLSAKWPLGQTFFPQMLAHASTKETDPDAPPGFARLIGATGDQEQRKCAFKKYETGIEGIASNQNRDRDRRERALDHLLARFGEAFPVPPQEDAFSDTVERKRRFVNDIVMLSGARCTAPAVPAPAQATADAEFEGIVARRIEFLAGLETAPVIIEHALLRPTTEDVAPILPFHALRLSRPGGPVHIVMRNPFSGDPMTEVKALDATVLANPSSATIGLYFLDSDRNVCAQSYERFPVPEAANAAAQAVFEARGNARRRLAPTDLPPDPFGPRVTLFLTAPAGATSAYRDFVERVADDNIPSHLAGHCLWVDEGGFQQVRDLRNRWWRRLGENAAVEEAESLRRIIAEKTHERMVEGWAEVEEALP